MDLEEGVAMAPTKVAKKLLRVAEKKGKAEDQYQLACLFYYETEAGLTLVHFSAQHKHFLWDTLVP